MPKFDNMLENGQTASGFSYSKTSLKGLSATTEFAGDAEQEFLRGWHDGQDALKATLDLFRSPKPAAEELSTGDGGQSVAGDPQAGYSAGEGDEQVDSPPWMPEENLAELVEDSD